MKYHNFKKVLAAFLVAALTVGSTAFVASATEAVGDITYTLAGGSSNNDGTGNYVVDVDAVGGLINIGAITVEYDADLYSGVTFTPAENIVDASLFWGVGEQTAGEFTFAFSSDNADDDVADLFAVDNPSGTIAYIDATNAVNIGTLTFEFADENTYASTFTTKTVANNTITATAQNILHAKDGYDTSKQDAEIEITNTLVFTADDFTVEDTEATYKANTPQAPSVDSSVAKEFTLALDDDGATEVINAGTYAIKVVDVSGKGYYDADEIDLGANFVIKKAEVTITAPADPAAVNYVAPDGYDLANLKIEGWNIVTTGKLDAGTYDIEVKYAGELDTANNIYIYNENEVTSADDITATVELVVNKIAGEVPALENPAAVTYNAEVAQTVTGYEVELSEDWEFVDANAALAIGENKDIAVKFVPDDTTNYEYEGYDETLGYVPGKVTVTVNKAQGTAPEAPVVNKTEIRLDAVGGEVAITEFVTPGVWSTDVEKLAVGKHTVNYTYKPADQNKYDYSECEGWNNETNQFEYSVKVEVLKPYLKDLVVPPTAPDAKDFAEGTTYKYSDFALAAGWVYASPDTTVENAGTIENVKVLYAVQADYEVDPADGYTVEDGKIVSYVTITVNKIALPTDKITFTTQNSVYTGNAVEIDKANLVITGISGVDADDVTLVYEEDKTAINAGTYKVYATVAATDNYEAVVNAFEVGTVVVAKADVTKDMFTVADYDHKYDGNAKTANVTVKTEYAEIGAPTVTYNPAEVKAVGEYAIIVAGAETANYNAYADITLDIKLTISKGKIVIKKPVVDYDVDYVEGGFDLSTVKIDGWTTISTQKVDAGKSAITVEYAGTLDTDNYEYEFDGATVTYPPRAYPTIIVRKINLPADPLKIDDNDFTYNGSAQKATVSLKNTLTGVGTIAVTYKQGETVVADPTDAGTYDVYATVAEGKNYYGIDETKIGSYEIKKATVEKTDITLADTEHTYDGSKKTPTATSAKGGTAVVTVTGEAINAGIYTFTVSGDATTNYEAYSFTYENGLVIKRADVKESDFTVSDKSQPYDGSKKAPTVAKVTAGIGDPTITIDEVINVGKYTFTVSGPESTNYNAYSFEYTEGFEITKRTITIAKPENIGATNYIPGGINAATIEYPINWAYNDEVDKMLEAGVDQAIKVKYTATLDTANNDYVAGEGVEGNANDGFTSTVTITVNQIAGTIPALTTSYEATYNNDITDKKVTSYITIADAKWTLTDADAVLEYKDDNKYAVETVLDTKNYTYAAVEGVTVGDGKATAEITVKFNKATLPTDAATATTKTTEYTGSAITVEVAKNEDYKGLGEFTVAYPEGNINVGTYDVTATFAEGENYLGGTVTFTNALTITKQVLQNISGPTFDKTEAIVGEEIKNDAGEGFKFAEDYVIKEGNNEIKVTKTIDGDFAKNYDYTEAAEKVGLTVSIDETTGDVTLTKTFNVIGKYATGTVSLKAIAIDGAPMEGITVTVTPENGEATALTFTTNENEIIVDKAELTAGKYTIKVKMLKYLEYTINFTLEGGAALDLGSVDLIAGDIVGGPAGQETFGDGVIDIDDFVIAIRAFDTESSAAVKDAADINGDGANSVTDLGYIKANFNKTTADCIKTID